MAVVSKDGSVVIATVTTAPGNNFNGPSTAVSGANSNRALIFKVAVAEAGAPTISGITWNGQSAALVTGAAALSGPGNVRLEIWRILNPTAGTAVPVVSLSGSIQGAVCTAQSLYNVDQTTPFGTARTNSGTAGTIADVGCAGVTNGLTIGAMISGDTTTAIASRNGIPYWVASGTETQATAQTSHTCNQAPTGRQLGDIEVVTFDTETAAAHSLSGAGWAIIEAQATYATTHSRTVATRVYDGTNVDPAISWSGAADVFARRHIWRDSKVTGTIISGVGTVGTGTASPHTSTGGNTTANNVLAVYLDTCNANTAVATPAGWAERFDAGSATGPARTAGGDKEVATSGTSTGNISIVAGAAAWIQRQYQLFPSDAGTQTHEVESENIASLVSFADVSEAGQAFNTLGCTLTGGVDEWIAVAVSVNPVAASGDMTGSSSLTFSQQATATAYANGQASSTLTFAMAGSAAGLASGNGSSSINFTATANGDLIAQLVGSSSLSFAVNGTVQAYANASASSSIAFDQSGVLMAYANAIASTSVSWSMSGSASGLASGTGSASLSFGTSGNLLGYGNMAATSDISFAVSAVLSAYAILNGSSSISFDVVGNISSVGTYSGSSSITFAASATVAAYANMQGSTSISFTASGSSGSTVDMTGSSSISFTATGMAAALLNLQGSSSLSFSTNASLSAYANVEVDVTISFTVSGSVYGLADMSGTTSIVFSALLDTGIEFPHNAVLYDIGVVPREYTVSIPTRMFTI